MLHLGQTIKGSITHGGQPHRYLVVRAGVIRKNGSQRVTARRQSEGVGGTLVETEITLNFPDPDDISPWEVVGK